MADTSKWQVSDNLAAVVEMVPPLAPKDISHGEVCLIRADLDLPIIDGKVVDSARVEATLETVKLCIEAGAVTVLMGHIGRDPKTTLAPVAETWQSVLDIEVTLIEDWFDESTMSLTPEVKAAIEQARAGDVLMLQNTRKYTIETKAWGLSNSELSNEANKFGQAATNIANAFGGTQIIECVAASNFDFSSAILPLAMSKVRLGLFLRNEMIKPVSEALGCNAIIMSGLKSNKLDDIEGMLAERELQAIFVAGAIAMPLLKARAEMQGHLFELGQVASDSESPAYVEPTRVTQAGQILKRAEDQGVVVHLPEDFVTQEGKVVSGLQASDYQFDVGPKTIMSFEAALQKIADMPKGLRLFLNGAPGRYEMEEYSMGSKSLVKVVEQLSRDGSQVFVGGGDGRAAFETFGDLDNTKYAFTSGGTILKLMAGKSIPYLQAAALAQSA